MENSLDDDPLCRARDQLAAELCARAIKLVTAESCTGGCIAKVCTDLPGSSAWFSGAAVTYSDAAKMTLLGVDAALLRQHGAVSAAVVSAMVKQSLRKVPTAHLAIAVSGVAGPSGGSAEKPVGTVWIAWQQRQQQPTARCFHFGGDRHAIRAAAALQALNGAIALLQEESLNTRPSTRHPTRRSARHSAAQPSA